MKKVVYINYAERMRKMSNTRLPFKEVVCNDRDICTSDKYHCKTCLRNKANIYEDKFSLKKGGFNQLSKWIK